MIIFPRQHPIPLIPLNTENCQNTGRLHNLYHIYSLPITSACNCEPLEDKPTWGGGGGGDFFRPKKLNYSWPITISFATTCKGPSRHFRLSTLPERCACPLQVYPELQWHSPLRAGKSHPYLCVIQRFHILLSHRLYRPQIPTWPSIDEINTFLQTVLLPLPIRISRQNAAHQASVVNN